MSKKFVRNITDIEEIEKQELDTNIQNDILSTNDKDVYIRTGWIYHEITNKVKDIFIKNNFNNDYMVAVANWSKDNKKNKYHTIDFKPLLDKLREIDINLSDLRDDVDYLLEENEKAKNQMWSYMVNTDKRLDRIERHLNI